MQHIFERAVLAIALVAGFAVSAVAQVTGQCPANQYVTAVNNGIVSLACAPLVPVFSTPVTVPQGGTGVTSLTAHGLVTGEGTAAVTVTAAGTSGIPLIGQGASADPVFGTAVVAGGGTGLATITAHGVMLGEGTSNVAAVAPGSTSGVALISQGASADPAYGTVVVAGGGTGLVSGTSGGVLGFTASGTLASSAALAVNGVVIGGGAGATPTAITAGTAGQFLVGAAGAPSFVTPASSTTVPGNPSAITPGTTTAQYLGLGANTNPSVLTPTATGRVRFQISGSASLASTTNGATFTCYYGTGTAPANASTSVVGTAVGAAIPILEGASGAKTPFTCGGTLTGATLSTGLWFDVVVLNTTGAQATTVTGVTFTATEY